MLKILQRYVLLDILKTFFLAVAIFTGIVLLGLIYEFVRAELSLGQMYQLIPYGLPFTLPFTLPIAALLATSLTFGRLWVDNEINAMRTAGVPLSMILAPVLVFGILLSAVSLYLQDRVIPPWNYKVKDVRMLAAKLLMDQKDGYNFRRRFGPFMIFASRYGGNEFRGLVIFKGKRRREQDREMTWKIVARRGVVGIGEDEKSLRFTIYDASLTTYGSEDVKGPRKERGSVVPGQVRMYFTKHDLEIPIRSRAPRETDKPSGELLTDAAFHKEKALEMERSPDEGTRKAVKYSRSIYRKSIAEVNQRRSLAFACLLSVVIGCCLPILMKPRNALIPFFAGVLIVILFYFPLHRLGIVLSEEGKISPWIGPWISAILPGTLALTLLWRVVRR